MAQLLPISDEMIASRGRAGLDRAPGHPRVTSSRACRPALARSRSCRDRPPRDPSRTAPAPRPISSARSGLAVLAAGVAGVVGQVRQQPARHLGSVADDADGDLLGQADPVGLMSTWMILASCRPVIHAVAGQGGEGVEPGAEREDDVGLLDELHPRLRTVIAQRPGEQRVRAGEGVVVLVAYADRRIERLGKLHRGRDPALRQDHARPVQDDRVLRVSKQFRSLLDAVLAAGGNLEFDGLGDLDIDHLGPEIARHVDLRRPREALRLGDHAGQHLGHPARVADLFLIGHHVLEELHLLDFLEAALTDRLVCGLRRDEEERRVVPVGRLHGGDEVGDARAVLGDHHRHLAGRAGVAVGHEPGGALVGGVPEGDAGGGEDVRDRHHRGANDPEGVADAVALEDLNEGFLGGHLHCDPSRRKKMRPGVSFYSRIDARLRPRSSPR